MNIHLILHCKIPRMFFLKNRASETECVQEKAVQSISHATGVSADRIYTAFKHQPHENLQKFAKKTRFALKGCVAANILMGASGLPFLAVAVGVISIPMLPLLAWTAASAKFFHMGCKVFGSVLDDCERDIHDFIAISKRIDNGEVNIQSGSPCANTKSLSEITGVPEPVILKAKLSPTALQKQADETKKHYQKCIIANGLTMASGLPMVGQSLNDISNFQLADVGRDIPRNIAVPYQASKVIENISPYDCLAYGLSMGGVIASTVVCRFFGRKIDKIGHNIRTCAVLGGNKAVLNGHYSTAHPANAVQNLISQSGGGGEGVRLPESFVPAEQPHPNFD